MTKAMILLAAFGIVVAIAPAPSLATGGVASAAEPSATQRAQSTRPEPPKSARDMPPATGHAYFYRQIILALVIVAIVIAFLVWLVRRQTRTVDRA